MGLHGRLKERFCGKFPEFGAIFMSNASTREECFDRKLLGLPMSHADFVKGVKVGMILFLFEYERRQLHGVFKATSDGDIDIVPHAYSSSGKKFPAQVKFTTIWHCYPLREKEFSNIIRDNYFATNRFNFGLSKDQVQSLLGLFGSRMIKVSRSQSFIRSEIEKNYPESSKRRKMKRGKSTRTKGARKKLKGSSLDSSQSSLAFIAGHSSSSGLELLPNPDHAIQIQPVSVGEDVKELESSLNSDIELGDYIPLLQSDDSDSPDTRASPESGFFATDRTSLPFSLTGLYKDKCKPVPAASPIIEVGDVHIKENDYGLKSSIENHQEDNNSDYIYNLSVRGLYSDASNSRDSVFSRLNLSSGVEVKEDHTRVEKSVKRTRKQRNRTSEVDSSAQDIMEELQQMHDTWNETVGMPRSVERENDHTVSKRSSVFSRLSWD
ncbi:hypothetical protein CCACVL1_20199 [Corchorus capsularis]|uniref:DCD domain-containing protein n=1 Tax=Corchorus capsularis TaxID=210143 RepID=A0A1R3HC68_COCAP|nr:hypothetical protein CCACVL1_20199 [Corchorus capsularis]